MKLLFENWRQYLSEGLAQEEVQSIVDRVFDQIVNDRGPARQGKPKVELHADIYARHSGIAGMKGEVSEEAKAEFVDKDNAIYVYYPNMTNEEDVIRSLLHEYEHARQDPKIYEKYREEGFDGLDNPYEKAARKAEETWEKYSVNWAGKTNISYSGVVLDRDSVKHLKQMALDFGMPEGFVFVTPQGAPLPHHMTIKMGPLDSPYTDTYVVGEKYTLPVLSIGKDDRAMAVRVEVPGPIKTKSFPHVTVAVNKKDGKPFHSNKIPEENFEPPPYELLLSGIVQEVPQ